MCRTWGGDSGRCRGVSPMPPPPGPSFAPLRAQWLSPWLGADSRANPVPGWWPPLAGGGGLVWSPRSWMASACCQGVRPSRCPRRQPSPGAGSWLVRRFMAGQAAGGHQRLIVIVRRCWPPSCPRRPRCLSSPAWPLPPDGAGNVLWTWLHLNSHFPQPRSRRELSCVEEAGRGLTGVGVIFLFPP